MAKWYKIPTTMRMTRREYDANLRGMNIVFGAVLGFVLAGTTELSMYDFCFVLFTSAAIVVCILYLAYSPYKLFYVILTALVIWGFPHVLEDPMNIVAPPRLQATLGVWAFMIVLVELVPREGDAEPSAEDEEARAIEQASAETTRTTSNNADEIRQRNI